MIKIKLFHSDVPFCFIFFNLLIFFESTLTLKIILIHRIHNYRDCIAFYTLSLSLSLSLSPWIANLLLVPNTTNNFEQVLEAAPHKAAAVRSLTTQNYPS